MKPTKKRATTGKAAARTRKTSTPSAAEPAPSAEVVPAASLAAEPSAAEKPAAGSTEASAPPAAEPAREPAPPVEAAPVAPLAAQLGAAEKPTTGPTEAATPSEAEPVRAPVPPVEPTPDEPSEKPLSYIQEVRFAVVMYGGVSLAIYINGVAQEVLEMVRATALNREGGLAHPNDISGSGKIYRRIAQYLGSERTGDSLASLLTEDHWDEPIRTRFVADIISGTSAGGLNGIFLAKALANDQDMTGLTQLWMNEGDISRLLNDEKSVENEPTLTSDKYKNPESLLNSERMYDKLLKALHTMDFPGEGPATPDNAERAGVQPSPLVEELDLFVTTTDLTGLRITMRLDDTVADERRHRNVFHFRYAQNEIGTVEKHDFKPLINPFLAFSGRCTSSFPFAFEPMQLEDIWDVLGRWSYYHALPKDLPAGTDWKDFYLDHWKSYYSDYTNAGENFRTRAFGDGGYLDNKPFTYATRTLMRRRATRPVIRKLIYVEPAPEFIPPPTDNKSKPSVLDNVTAALLTLPRYETIREDLQEVMDRNKLLDQVARLTNSDELDDIVHQRPAVRKDAHSFSGMSLSELIQTFGVSYAIYHRLKVDDVTESLAAAITHAAGFDSASSESEAFQLILEVWRKQRYSPNPNTSLQNPELESVFLLNFDVGYRLRRLYFLETRINRLSAASTTSTAGDEPPSAIRAENRADLLIAKKIVSTAIVNLRQTQRSLDSDPDLLRELQALIGNPAPEQEPREVLRAELRKVLENPKHAEILVQANGTQIDKIAGRIAGILKDGFTRTATKLEEYFPAPGSTPTTGTGDGRNAVQADLRKRYSDFEWYDMVILPLEHGTDAGETRHVDIVRISPLDAPNLIEETIGNTGRKKLAGTALWAFGAFLARFWRANDMLWGRLDAAEIIAKNVLKDSGLAPGALQKLIDELHSAILVEWLTEKKREEIGNLMRQTFEQNLEGASLEESMQAALQSLDGLEGLDERLKKVMAFCLNDAELLNYFKKSYEVSRDLDPATTFPLVGRAARVTGKILRGLADKADLKKAGALIAGVTASFWGIVEISVPGSYARTVAHHLGALAYLIALFLLAAGFFTSPAVFQIGLLLLGAILAIHAISFALYGLMRRKPGGFKALLMFIGVLIVALAVWGAYDVIQRIEKWRTPPPANVQNAANAR